MKNSFFSANFAWRQQGRNSLHRVESREGECMMNKSKTAAEEREKNQRERKGQEGWGEGRGGERGGDMGAGLVVRTPGPIAASMPPSTQQAVDSTHGPPQGHPEPAFQESKFAAHTCAPGFSGRSGPGVVLWGWDGMAPGRVQCATCRRAWGLPGPPAPLCPASPWRRHNYYHLHFKDK